MKIQCSCGAKYVFDITPVMRNQPVKFVCPARGPVPSGFGGRLTRRKLGQAATPTGVPVPIALPGTPTPPPPVPPPPPPPPRPAVAVRVHISPATQAAAVFA